MLIIALNCIFLKQLLNRFYFYYTPDESVDRTYMSSLALASEAQQAVNVKPIPTQLPQLVSSLLEGSTEGGAHACALLSRHPCHLD